MCSFSKIQKLVKLDGLGHGMAMYGMVLMCQTHTEDLHKIENGRGLRSLIAFGGHPTVT